jgi:hypothetical protein
MLSCPRAQMANNTPDANGLRGVIINCASVAAIEGQKGQVAYGASKGAVAAMTLPMARDLGSYGIRVLTIAPGIFGTPMMAAASDQVKAGLAVSVVAPKRLGLPEEFAQLTLHCIDNAYLNGETIRLECVLLGFAISVTGVRYTNLPFRSFSLFLGWRAQWRYPHGLQQQDLNVRAWLPTSRASRLNPTDDTHILSKPKTSSAYERSFCYERVG